MKYYGIKRVRGKGYENHYVIRRKKKRTAEAPFLFFLVIFGGLIYLFAFALFRSLSLPDRWITAVAFSL